MVLHEGLPVAVLLCGSETIWREKKRSRIRAVQIGNLRGLLGIRRINRVPKVRIRKLCGISKGVDESDLRLFSHIERIKNDRTAKRVYVRECVGNR